MEIISLKRTNQELDAEQKYEIDRLKDQSRKDKEELAKVFEKTKQVFNKILPKLTLCYVHYASLMPSLLRYLSGSLPTLQ